MPPALLKDVTVGTRIRTIVEFSGVPVGTTGKVIKISSPKNRHMDVEYAIQWDLVRPRPLVDWFSETEFRDFLEILPSPEKQEVDA